MPRDVFEHRFIQHFRERLQMSSKILDEGVQSMLCLLVSEQASLIVPSDEMLLHSKAHKRSNQPRPALPFFVGREMLPSVNLRAIATTRPCGLLDALHQSGKEGASLRARLLHGIKANVEGPCVSRSTFVHVVRSIASASSRGAVVNDEGRSFVVPSALELDALLCHDALTQLVSSSAVTSLSLEQLQRYFVSLDDSTSSSTRKDTEVSPTKSIEVGDGVVGVLYAFALQPPDTVEDGRRPIGQGQIIQQQVQKVIGDDMLMADVLRNKKFYVRGAVLQLFGRLHVDAQWMPSVQELVAEFRVNDGVIVWGSGS